MNTDHQERLRRTLLENGEHDAEALKLAQLSAWLNQVPAVLPQAEHQHRLLKQLEAQLPPLQTRWHRLRHSYALQLLLSQRRIIQREIWWASAFLLVLGVLISLAQDASSVAFVIIAPMVAAGGVALLYDDETAFMLELEESTRASARQLLLARLTLLFSFDLALALLGSLILAIFRADLSLIGLIATWLAPMSFLTGLAFFLSIVLLDTLAASLFSLSLWVFHHLLRSIERLPSALDWLRLAGFSEPYFQPFLGLCGALLVVLALFYLGFKERSLSKDAP